MNTFKPSPSFQKKKWKASINFLNDLVKVKIAPSKIHGVGIVAMRKIKKGEKLETDAVPHQFDVPFKMFKELRKDVREVILGFFPQVVNGSHFLYPVTRMQAYMNHSDDPNYSAKDDVILKDVDVGEEITENYKEIDGWEKIFPWLDKEKGV